MSEARCSWCRKEPAEVAILIEGQGGAYICDECAELCVQIAREKKPGLSRAAPARGEMPPSVEKALARLRKLVERNDPSESGPPPLP
jgi:ATP-dependent protease Clp ATPase subunit